MSQRCKHKYAALQNFSVPVRSIEYKMCFIEIWGSTGDI